MIAQKYLVPAAAAQSGVGSHFVVSEEALIALMRGYCRESGVRSLQKHIDKVDYSPAGSRFALPGFPRAMAAQRPVSKRPVVHPRVYD